MREVETSSFWKINAYDGPLLETAGRCLYLPLQKSTDHHLSLWVSGITLRATESYFTSLLSVAVHFNIQNIRYFSHSGLCWHINYTVQWYIHCNIHRDLPASNKYREVCDFSREVIPLTHSALLINLWMIQLIQLLMIFYLPADPRVRFCMVKSGHATPARIGGELQYIHCG